MSSRIPKTFRPAAYTDHLTPAKPGFFLLNSEPIHHSELREAQLVLRKKDKVLAGALLNEIFTTIKVDIILNEMTKDRSNEN